MSEMVKREKSLYTSFLLHYMEVENMQEIRPLGIVSTGIDLYSNEYGIVSTRNEMGYGNSMNIERRNEL